MANEPKIVASYDYTDPEANLKMWLEAHATVSLMGQSYQSADGRIWTGVDSDKILRNIQFWEARVAAASGSNPSQILARFPGR